MTPTAAPGEASRRYPDRILPKNAEAAAKLKERLMGVGEPAGALIVETGQRA